MICGTANFIGWTRYSPGNSIDETYQAVRGINVNLLAVFFIVVLAGVLLYNLIWTRCRRKIQQSNKKSIN